MDILELHFIDCCSLSTKTSVAAVDLLEALKSCGGSLLSTSGGPVDKKPSRCIDQKGNIIIQPGIEHEVLAKNRFHYMPRIVPPHQHGTGSFGYIHASREFDLHQDVNENNQNHWDEIASGLLAFVNLLYPRLRPKYGWIGESGYTEDMNLTKLSVLSWANIFGPELVNSVGKDFLLKAPGWKKEELDDGGILYVIEPLYHTWHLNPSQEALRYFQTKMPRIKPFGAKPFGFPDELVRAVLTDDATGKETVVYERDKKKPTKKKGPKK